MPHKGIQGSNPCFSAIAKHEVRHWDVWPRSFLVHLLVHQIFGGYRTKSVSGPIIHRRYSTAAWSSPHTTPEPCSSGRSVVPPLRLRGHREEPLDILVDGHDAQDPCGRQGVFRMHAVSPEDRPHAACATARGGSAPSPGVARSRRPPPRWRRSLTRPTRRSSQATHRTLGENKAQRRPSRSPILPTQGS